MARPMVFFLFFSPLFRIRSNPRREIHAEAVLSVEGICMYVCGPGGQFIYKEGAKLETRVRVRVGVRVRVYLA